MPCCNVATRKRLQRLFCRPCNYTAQTSKSFTRLYRGISVDFPYSSAHNTAATQAAYAPLAPCWRASRHAGRCTAQHSRPIIIMYIRVQGCAPVMDPCPAVHHSTDHANGSGSVHSACIRCRDQRSGWRSGTGSAWHTPPGGAVQQQGHGGAEPLTATAASLFGLSPDS